MNVLKYLKTSDIINNYRIYIAESDWGADIFSFHVDNERKTNLTNIGDCFSIHCYIYAARIALNFSMYLVQCISTYIKFL